MLREAIRAAALAMLAAGCASMEAEPPKDWLPRRGETPTDAFGAWVALERADGSIVQGELIAVSPDSVYILAQAFLVEPRAPIGRARVFKYDPEGWKITTWTAIGAAATLSNGFILIFTAPAWVVVGVLAARSNAAAARVDIPSGSWEDAIPHARFPQGLPPVERDALRPRQLRASTR